MTSDFTVFDWQRLLLGLPPELYMLEIGLKILIIFAILLLVLRLLGKHGQQNLSPMQQLLMIALGSAAGDALLYPEVPIAYAAVILLGVTVLTVGLEKLSEHVRPVRNYVESHPRILVKDGEIHWDALHSERTTRRELFAELRIKGARSLSQVELAILEVTGDISVFLNDRSPANQDLLDYVVDEDKHEPSPPED
ncbi:MAG: hypothetical protein A2579_11000 [Lysobacterales bacterium RIFOXYD1_FULL_69_11]|nr:MAG: hypothetical protein A2190_03480 [Xanthomonadales bacterium RIFOXYA1_FULL_69_10]OHE88706.1 MAG: hypothetical protein A2579_11000 [Xanthomonadales bacterium RIFOXYD1_FULL_69_11]